MEFGTLVKIGLLFVCTLASAFFSGSESALFTLGFYRVRRLKADHPLSYRAAQKLLREPTQLISTILAGNELVNTSIGVLGSVLVYDWFHGRMNEAWFPLIVVCVVLPFVLIFGEIIPKTWGMKNPERVVAWVAVPLVAFSELIAPFRNLLSWFSNLILAMTGKSNKAGAVSEEMFRVMVDTGRQEGVLGAQEQSLIHNVFRLDDLKISQIMTPKGNVSFLQEDMTIEEVMKKFEKDRYSRFPVLSRSREQVVGVLYVKDLIEQENYKVSDEIKSFVRPHLKVLPTTNALELFVQFRMKKTHFAVVTENSSAEILGVVTLENVLEEIFGDIRDEHDMEEGAKSIP